MNFLTHILLDQENETPTLWSWGMYYQKSSKVYQWIRLIFISTSILAIILYLFYSTSWGLIKLITKNKKNYYTRLIYGFHASAL